jgi:hypothetical protein
MRLNAYQSERKHGVVALVRGGAALFTVDRDLRDSWPELDIVPLVGDVGDRERMRAVVFTGVRPGEKRGAAQTGGTAPCDARPAWRNLTLAARAARAPSFPALQGGLISSMAGELPTSRVWGGPRRAPGRSRLIAPPRV